MTTFEFNNLPEKKEVIVMGVPVQYYESGSGIPLVLLHGWPQTSHIWRKVWPELKKHYHIFAIELPGMGNDNAAQSADTKTVAQLVKSLCDQLLISNFHLVAHDIGAWVAVAFAFEYEQYLRSLTILDAGIPALIPDEVFSPMNAKKIWQFYFHAIEEIPEFLIAGREREYLTWYFTKKVTSKNAISDADIAVYVAAYSGLSRLKNGFGYYRAYGVSVNQNKSYQHKLAVPMLAIGGENAQGLNMGIAMQKVTNKQVQAVSIAECGHYITEEKPEEFLELVLPFLKAANDR